MFKSKKHPTKSPLKGKPLRNPGQSLEAEIDNLLYEGILFDLFLPVIFIMLAVMEWHRHFFPRDPSPWMNTIIAILSIFYAAYKIYPKVKKIRNLAQGRDGERAVGQLLETLRSKRAFVFHDIQCDGFNIDHVVVHETGIYVIETKTYSKPEKGKAVITFDGEKILLNDNESYSDPITQVLSASKWLQRQIEESTGKQFNLKEVVLFPGWYIQPTAEAKKSDVWVLEPKALPAFIENSKPKYTMEDVNLVQFHLSRYIRTKEKERTS